MVINKGTHHIGVCYFMINLEFNRKLVVGSDTSAAEWDDQSRSFDLYDDVVSRTQG